MNVTMPRDPAAERLLALSLVPAWRQAGAGRLADSANDRAGSAPVDLPPGRKLVREFDEECADILNYATWAARRGEVSEAAAARACALVIEAFTVMAFDSANVHPNPV